MAKDDWIGERESELTAEFQRVLGWGPVTASERKKWLLAIKELRIVGATPKQVQERTRAYQRRFPGLPCAPWNVVEHWGELGAPTSTREWPEGFIPGMGWVPGSRPET